jgi:diguanylate cyclase (GGDEF)-like protein
MVPLGALADLLRDEPTQLGSLLSLRRHLELMVDRFQPFGTRPALLLIDIDGFRGVNTAYGRATADEVLAATAGRLRRLVPGDDATYRTGGDEFAAVLESAEMIDVVSVAGQIQAALSEEVDVGGSFIPLTVSIAVVMLGYRDRVDGLLRDADVTMYRAKTEGGNRVDLYNWELDSWSTARKRNAEKLQEEVEQLRDQNRILAEALTVDLETGMPNALAFDADHLQSEAWRSRSGETYSLLRVCVDGVYQYGQQFRTPKAGEALVSVAHAIRDTVRQSDRAYVLERGESVVLLRGSTIKQAVMAAERIRARVDQMALPDPARQERRLTVTLAAIEAGFRHSGPADVLDELNRLLADAVAHGGARIVWLR